MIDEHRTFVIALDTLFGKRWVERVDEHDNPVSMTPDRSHAHTYITTPRQPLESCIRWAKKGLIVSVYPEFVSPPLCA